MARQPRTDAPGSFHHVWTRGLERRAIFVDDVDRADLVQRMGRVFPECGMRCFAWALLSNHFHLLVQTGEVTLSRTLKRLSTGYAVAFNVRHGRVGYLFQSRFGSRLVTSQADLSNLMRYVHLNPVRAGLVRDIRGLERYRWSGYAALAGTRPALAFESVADSLSFLDPDPGRARARLGSWMGQALELPVAASPTASPLDERDLRELVRIVCERAGISEADLLQGSRDRAVSRARALLCYLAVAELGLSGRQVARALGVTPGAVSQSIQRGRSLARLAGSDGALF